MFTFDNAQDEDSQVVTKVTFSEEGGGRLTFHLSNGDVYSASNAKFREALSHFERSVMQAAPGTYELQEQFENGELHVRKLAVIGWVVSWNGCVTPLTATSRHASSGHAPTILHPNGSVDHILSHHDSYDQWLDYVKKSRTQEAALPVTINHALATLVGSGEVVAIEEIDPASGELRQHYYAREHAPKPS
jgi:hypothetical protein